jgi:uncharacterized protein (TIGR03435 family)
MPISVLAHLLGILLGGRPVVDKTDLKGTYEIDLSYVVDEFDPIQAQVRAMSAPEAAEDGGRGGATPLPANDAGSPMPTLFQAVQNLGPKAIVEQLGLKLEAKKAPVSVLVVDHFNRIPSDN